MDLRASAHLVHQLPGSTQLTGHFNELRVDHALETLLVMTGVFSICAYITGKVPRRLLLFCV